MAGRSAVRRMSVITPSFAPDFELCVELHRSILDNSADSVHHHIIVPRSDIKLFGRLAGQRTHILCEADFLPRSFVHLPGSNFTFNLRRLFPPVRGWILQQIVKLAAVAASDSDVVVVVELRHRVHSTFRCRNIRPKRRCPVLQEAR